ncbi:DoxX family membrane protein [Streptomyces sp. HD]|uniref:DoxX family membrane protein n=1 Tax=Streptomyces sp. HD TaxID=3020892 RepID=UPI00232B6EAE|nr:DoxX family membrane protein [Streptomyces sp. HD]MDC0773361.1 DoxX family membrane protein [Streptomyces sp. HD]
MRLYTSAANRLSRLNDPLMVVVRTTIGWLMILHSLFKSNILGLDNFENFLLRPTGLPFTSVLRWLVPSMELACGGLLVLGLLARVAAALLSLEMLGTAVLVKLDALHLGVLGPKGSGGAEVDILMLAALLAVLVLGPGTLSLDSLLGLDRKEEAVQSKPSQPLQIGTSGEGLTREPLPAD